MSDEQASLDIVIRTRAETEGLETVAGLMSRGIEEAGEFGEALSAPRGRESGGEASPARTSHDGHSADEPEIQGAAPKQPKLPGHASPVPEPGAGGIEMPDLRAVELQARSIEMMGEQIRSALEDNSAATLDVLHRILALIEHQNQQLADIDKELGQLAGRVKGLKNP